MVRISILFSIFIFLGGCSSVINGQMQDVTIETPGAENALCTLETEGNKYRAYSGQTITIRRSRTDLLVECKAAGNREAVVHAKNTVNGWVFANVLNGFVPGAAYDYVSRGAFDYPETIVVNFVGMPVKPYDLPDYHSDDLRHNNAYNKSVYLGPTIVETEENKEQTPLEMKALPYGGKATPKGVVYPRSNSIIPYDPNEENK